MESENTSLALLGKKILPLSVLAYGELFLPAVDNG